VPVRSVVWSGWARSPGSASTACSIDPSLKLEISLIAQNTTIDCGQ